MKPIIWIWIAVTFFGTDSTVTDQVKIPADKAVITIETIAGNKGAVVFKHAAHSTSYKKSSGTAIACKDCHHTLQGLEQPQPCGMCHAPAGEKPYVAGDKTIPVLATHKTNGKINHKSVLFHRNCVDGCHKTVVKEGKKLKDCKVCHKKK